jgi:hypothetical protein
MTPSDVASERKSGIGIAQELLAQHYRLCVADQGRFASTSRRQGAIIAVEHGRSSSPFVKGQLRSFDATSVLSGPRYERYKRVLQRSP